MSGAEVVVDGVRLGEGPVWRPDTGDLVCTSVCDGLLWRIDTDRGAKEVLADIGGGPNGAALCRDGGLLVTQNGGIDYSKFPSAMFGEELPTRHATPGLQRVDPEGKVRYVADDGFEAPNDLAVAADGTVYFTDPGSFPPADPPTGRVMALDADGSVRTVATGLWYCNGIALDRDGRLVVIEGHGLRRLEPDGGRTWIVEKLGRGGGDGFCLDGEGRFYVAATVDHGVRVVEPDGAVVELLSLSGHGVTTNCCFGGPDLRTLFATDAASGQVVAWEAMPTAGIPLPTWAG
ncbi:MAG TPA: SMP-30/gluconolactonase/LRE family protein [Acidimicrobiales bacterium]|nr:SMP-30/gluconolactonase/LRE family protein [Acidimicrobiales bacterium]